MSTSQDNPTQRVLALANLLTGALQGQEHGVALAALLSVYRGLLQQHPCCIPPHMAALAQLAEVLGPVGLAHLNRTHVH